MRQGEQPLTRAMAAATAGQEGADVSGYRDYRGVPSVGSWTWLKDFDIGLVTELDIAEALARTAEDSAVGLRVYLRIAGAWGNCGVPADAPGAAVE